MTNHTATTAPTKNLFSLLPFAVFLGIFLGTGIVLTMQGVDFAFYQLPASIAIIPAIIIAIFMGKQPISDQIGQFINGAGHPNIITMCFIYLLAGAFAVVAKATGSVDASVQLGLSLFPDFLLLPGLFLVAAFISTAMGTSMGTIAAIAPIALGLVEASNVDSSVIAGVIISGAIFGDNLSIISDTTIASTRSQGAKMKDKFRVNFTFAVPAAILCIILFASMGVSMPSVAAAETNIVGLIPYLAILILALLGVNVFIVLVIGIVLAAAVGMWQTDYVLSTWISDINQGFANMQDLFILALFIGGLSELIKRQGGLAALTDLVERIARRIYRNNNKRAAGFGIACLAFICNFFTANNTVSIIVTGETAKELAEDGALSPAHSASILDIFACINQGLLPYGAQALLLGTTLQLSPLAVVSHAYYPMILLFVASIAFWRVTKK